MPDIAAPAPEPACPGWLRLSCERDGATVRVVLTGELDIATAPLLHRQLRRAQGDGETVVIDLRGLRFIDCGGARLLLTAHRRARWVGGRLIVVRGPSDVERMFGLVGVDRQLELVDAQPREAVGSR